MSSTPNIIQYRKVGGVASSRNLLDLPEVTGVSPGFIQTGTSASGTRRIKIGDMLGGILLTVRHGSRVQEVKVYTKNGQTTKLQLARKLREAGIEIGFKRD